MFSVRSITVFCFDLMCFCSLICTVYCSTMFAWRIKIFKYVWKKKTVDTWGCRSLCRISQLCITAPPLCQSTHQISQYRCDQNVQNFARFLRSSLSHRCQRRESHGALPHIATWMQCRPTVHIIAVQELKGVLFYSLAKCTCFNVKSQNFALSVSHPNCEIAPRLNIVRDEWSA